MRIKKVDNNQKSLVAQIRKIPGISVAHTHTVGNGFVDVVCGFRGKNYLFEIKDPSKPPSKKKLTEDEQKFHDSWNGSVNIVETIDDVLEILELK